MSWYWMCHCIRYAVGACAGELSSELAEARRPRDDFAHLIRSDFVAAELEKFTRDVLNLANAKSKRHQPRANGHQTAAHQPGEAATLIRSRNQGFRARNRVDQGLDFVGWALAAKETQDNANSFFGHNTIDAGLVGQLSNQFIHIA